MNLTFETLQLILFLMPGFIGAGVHSYIRNSTIPPSAFLILAVLFGMFSALATLLLNISPGVYVSIAKEQDYNVQVEALVQNPYFWVHTTTSVFLGFVTAILYESRRMQHALESVGLTRHYSVDDVWEQTFRDNSSNWLVLHLKDGRRLIGYAHYYSMTDQSKMITLRNAKLVPAEFEKTDEQQEPPQSCQMRGDLLLVGLSDVQWIEFIDPNRPM